jgi:hypothetical protein
VYFLNTGVMCYYCNSVLVCSLRKEVFILRISCHASCAVSKKKLIQLWWTLSISFFKGTYACNYINLNIAYTNHFGRILVSKSHIPLNWPLNHTDRIHHTQSETLSYDTGCWHMYLYKYVIKFHSSLLYKEK